VYIRIKEIIANIDSSLVLNYQKYYISIKASKNIAFITFHVKKIRLVVLMPEQDVRNIITHYPVASLSKAVQDYYNGPCAAVDIDNMQHEQEIITLINRLVGYHKGGQFYSDGLSNRAQVEEKSFNEP